MRSPPSSSSSLPTSSSSFQKKSLWLPTFAGLVIVQIFLNYSLFVSSDMDDSNNSSALISVLSECPVCETKQPSNARSSSSVGDGYRKKNNSIIKEILQRRPNWRDGFDDIRQWLPAGFFNRTDILEEENDGSMRNRIDDLSPKEEANIDRAFWESVSSTGDGEYSFGTTPGMGLGHRLSVMSYAYLCNVIPNRRQLLVHWWGPELDDTNAAWSYLFRDSPLIRGVPTHWKEQDSQRKVNQHRKETRTTGFFNPEEPGGIFKNCDCLYGDFNIHYNFHCGRSSKKKAVDAPPQCLSYAYPRDLWLLRFAQEPSVQEFYLLLRAQLRRHMKQKVADFIEENFPKDKLVIGVHIRAGNGKDDGNGHFDQTHRGEWINKNMTKAVSMVRKHIRMTAHSILDRFGDSEKSGFDKDAYDAVLDDKYRIFLATDSTRVLKEFKRQDPNVLSLTQDRIKAGEGVTIFKTPACKDSNTTTTECALRAQEAMLLDLLILSSCDATLAESYSNFLYSLPATIMMAEGRIFCQSGRAALGGNYIFDAEHLKQYENILGDAGWSSNPPANSMPVRCHQGSWAARDRMNLLVPEDVGS